MCSRKQLKANRANAQLSTGPTSDEGKSISSRNATTHGLTAKFAIVFDEDPTEFEAHATRMRDEFRPATPMENLLVDRIIQQSWRIGRAADAEREAIFQCQSELENLHSDMEDDDTPEQPLSAAKVLARSFITGDDTLNRVQSYELRIERSIFASIRALRQLRRETNSKGGEAQAERPQHVTKMKNEPILATPREGDGATPLPAAAA